MIIWHSAVSIICLATNTLEGSSLCICELPFMYFVFHYSYVFHDCSFSLKYHLNSLAMCPTHHERNISIYYPWPQNAMGMIIDGIVDKISRVIKHTSNTLYLLLQFKIRYPFQKPFISSVLHNREISVYILHSISIFCRWYDKL